MAAVDQLGRHHRNNCSNNPIPTIHFSLRKMTLMSRSVRVRSTQAVLFSVWRVMSTRNRSACFQELLKLALSVASESTEWDHQAWCKGPHLAKEVLLLSHSWYAHKSPFLWSRWHKKRLLIIFLREKPYSFIRFVFAGLRFLHSNCQCLDTLL